MPEPTPRVQPGAVERFPHLAGSRYSQLGIALSALVIGIGLVLIAAANTRGSMPWFLTYVGGFIFIWLSFVLAWAAFIKGRSKALLYGAVTYLAPGLLYLPDVLTGSVELLVAWPNWFIQGLIACPLDLPCPLGR